MPCHITAVKLQHYAELSDLLSIHFPLTGHNMTRATREAKKKNRYLSVLVVLRAVAGAGELVSRLVPGHNAAQVRAHSVDAEGLKGAVLLGHQVSGITLRTTQAVTPTSFFQNFRSHVTAMSASTAPTCVCVWERDRESRERRREREGGEHELEQPHIPTQL
jgi:hypothetical protein